MPIVSCTEEELIAKCEEAGERASRLCAMDRDRAMDEAQRFRAALMRIACLDQSTDLLWWQIEARKALDENQG